MSPTYEIFPRFADEWAKLTGEQKERFLAAKARLVEDLRRGDGRLRAGLRVKRVEGTNDVWEMTWAPDGRATFHFGPELRPGERHVMWRRIGTHEILANP